MIIRKQGLTDHDNSADDQWDGTDIEPVYPRNMSSKVRADLDDSYVKSHCEGDRFS